MKAVKLVAFLIFILLVGCNNSTRDISHEKYRELDLLVYDNTDTILPQSRKIENLDFVFDKIRRSTYSKEGQVRVFKIANRFFNLRLYEKYKDVVTYSLLESSKAVDTQSIAKSLFYLGDYYQMIQKPDSAFFFYKNAKEVYESSKSFEKAGDVLLQMSNVKTLENDWVGGEKLAIQALKYFDACNANEKTAFAYNILGVISINLKDYAEAIKIFNTGIRVLPHRASPFSSYLKEFLTFNLAVAYGEAGRKEEALIICENLLSNKREFIKEMPELYAALIAKRAELNFKLKSGKVVSDINFKRAIGILDSLSFPSNSIPVRIHLSEFYLSIHDTINSVKVAHEAYKLSESHRDRGLHILSLQQLINSDPKNAAEYSKQYVALSDSIQIAERKIVNKFARIELETDQLRKERDDAIMSTSIFYQTFSVFMVLLVSSLYFIYRKLGWDEIKIGDIKRKYEREIFEQASTQQRNIMEGRIMEKTRISRELHDGVLNDLALIRNNVSMVLDKGSPKGKWAACKRFLRRLQRVEREIHAISHDLNTNPILKGKKFRKLVDEIFRVQVQKEELEWSFYHDKSIKWKRREKDMKLDIFRTLQELIQNILKHSNASRASISIEGEENKISITATDNGNGFKSESTKSNGGIQNIRTRVAKYGGVVDIQSDATKGVKIYLEFSF